MKCIAISRPVADEIWIQSHVTLYEGNSASRPHRLLTPRYLQTFLRMLETAWSALLTVVVVVIVLGGPNALYMFLDGGLGFVASRAICFCLGFLLFPFARRIQFRNTRSDAGDLKGTDHTIYGLDHGRLNIALPPPTMWMNMGYWEVRLSSNQS